MARGPRRQDAIHHIDAEAGVLDNFLRRADAHYVAGLVGGKMFQRGFDEFAGAVARLADAETADGIAGEANLDGAFGGFFSQFQVHTALDDAEEGLGKAVVSGQWPVVSVPRLRLVVIPSRLCVVIPSGARNLGLLRTEG